MSHSFLKESKLYIVYGGNKYRIYTNAALSFSQTFAEDSYPVKTLHDQSKMFKGTTITKANPASFSFETPLTAEKDESIVISLLTGVSTNDLVPSFDMYVQTESSTFKIEGCAITSGNIAFNPKEQFKVAVEGQGSKLTRAGNGSYTIPGSAQSESATRTPLLVYPHVALGSLSMLSIIGVTVSIQNNLDWTPFETLHDSLAVTDSSNAMYPSAYTVNERVVSGAITQYQTDNNKTQFDDFSTSSSLTITGKKASDNTDYWTLTLNPVMFTSRLNVNDIYTQSYDFRSLDNGEQLNAQISTYS